MAAQLVGTVDAHKHITTHSKESMKVLDERVEKVEKEKEAVES